MYTGIGETKCHTGFSAEQTVSQLCKYELWLGFFVQYLFNLHERKGYAYSDWF